MDLQKTKESLQKAVEKLDKKIALLQKYEDKAVKQRSAIEANGWDPDNKFCLQGKPGYFDSYWAICEYYETLDSIRRTKSAIEEQNGVVARWREKLEKAMAEAKEQFELPEVLSIVRINIYNEWNRYDFERRARLKAEYSNMDHSAFIKKYTYSGYSFMRSTDDEIKNDNDRSSRALILNLWKRVKDITGPVTDVTNLHITNANKFEGLALNGYVIGENGVADLESILAGGYNIQKLHIRTLVHERQGGN